MSRPSRPLGAALAAAIAITTLAAPAAAQCEPEWRDLRGGVHGARYGLGPWASRFYEIDDGRGPGLYVSGIFRTAGGVQADDGVVRWDGWAWSAPIDRWGRVGDIAEFDDGSGPALYASIDIDGPCVARWDGSSWTVIGRANAGVGQLAVLDTGGGPELYAAGAFSEMEGIRAIKIARWDGVEWRSVGDGINGGYVSDVIVFDDGAGPALYVAGNLTHGTGAAFSRGIVRWDGEAWSGLVGRSVQETMDFRRLAVFDDGGGPALYGLSFYCDSTGCPRGGGVLRWDGSLWQQVGGTFAGWPLALEVIDDGSGPALFAGGRFVSIGGEPIQYLARWDGAAWSGFGEPNGSVGAITTFDEGAGPTIFIGGDFTRAGDIEVSGIAAFGCPPPACYADCNDDGQLNFFDFLCFQNLFAAGDPAADCDGSGSLDFADFLCYQDAFAAGCP